MNRRGFFKLAFAATAVQALPALAFESLPTIYADGEHDDTDGLQALMDCKPVHCRKGIAWVDDGRVTIENCELITTRPLRFTGANKFLSMRSITFNATLESNEHAIELGSSASIADCHICVTRRLRSTDIPTGAVVYIHMAPDETSYTGGWLGAAPPIASTQRQLTARLQNIMTKGRT